MRIYIKQIISFLLIHPVRLKMKVQLQLLKIKVDVYYHKIPKINNVQTTF